VTETIPPPSSTSIRASRVSAGSSPPPRTRRYRPISRAQSAVCAPAGGAVDALRRAELGGRLGSRCNRTDTDILGPEQAQPVLQRLHREDLGERAPDGGLIGVVLPFCEVGRPTSSHRRRRTSLERADRQVTAVAHA